MPSQIFRVAAILFVSISLSILIPFSRGDAAAVEPLSAAKITELVKPFIRSGTMIVMCADMARVDVKGLRQYMTAGVAAAKLSPQDEKDANDGIAQTADSAQRWIADFQKSGGRYVLMLNQGSGSQEILVAPLQPGADAHAIQGLLYSGKTDGPTGSAAPTANNPQMARWARQAEVVGNAVIVSNRAGIDQIKNEQPADRPELTAAFDLAGDAPVRIAVIPTDEMRTEIEQQAGKDLPPFLGGGPVSTFTRGVQWISIFAQMPPKTAATAIIHCADAATAQKADNALVAGVKFLSALPQQPGQLVWASLASALSPTVNGADVTIALDSAAVDKTMPALAAGFSQQRKSALQMQSLSQMRQLTIACQMYANDHKGDWPEKLDDVVANYLQGNKAVLKNPAHPDLDNAYVYVKPNRAALENHAQIIVIHEFTDKDSQIVNAGFADGHCERMQRADFEKKLTETETANEGGL